MDSVRSGGPWTRGQCFWVTCMKQLFVTNERMNVCNFEFNFVVILVNKKIISKIMRVGFIWYSVYPSAEKRVENMTCACSGVFFMKFDVFG